MSVARFYPTSHALKVQLDVIYRSVRGEGEGENETLWEIGAGTSPAVAGVLVTNARLFY